MKFKDWINYPVEKDDILLRCSDPSGKDADNYIYPIGCAEGFNKFKNLNSTDIFTNNPDSNTELLFNAFSTHTDIHRKNISKLKSLNLLKQEAVKYNSRIEYSKNLNNFFDSQSYSSNDYFKNIGKYKFVASPTGNGLDCHRHYETLISKGIPIIDYHPFLAKKFHGLPILWTKDFSEINPEYLGRAYNKFLDMDFDFRRLLFTHYSPEIRRQMLIIRKHQATKSVGIRDKQYWKFSDYF